jgi:hypothetical protein
MLTVCKHTTVYVPVRHSRIAFPQGRTTAQTFITKQAHRGFKRDVFSKIRSQSRIKVCYVVMNKKRPKTMCATVPTKKTISLHMFMNNKRGRRISNTLQNRDKSMLRMLMNIGRAVRIVGPSQIKGKSYNICSRTLKRAIRFLIESKQRTECVSRVYW